MAIHKANLILFILMLSNATRLVSQQTICIPNGSSPLIDGVIAEGEWDDADTVHIRISGSKKVTVKFKHDSVHLYIAYLNHLESAFRFPEIVFDVQNDKSTSWMEDDWWFHASASDCVSNGAPNDYSNCLAVQPDWEAVPNMLPGFPSTDTVEIRIPFSKLGIDISINHSIGLAFNVTNTSSIWNYWPDGANSQNPATWANAVFCTGTVHTAEQKDHAQLIIYPNPFSTHTTIRIGYALSNARITIYNSSWQIVKQLTAISGNEFGLSRDQLSNGMYFIQLKQGNTVLAGSKFVILD